MFFETKMKMNEQDLALRPQCLWPVCVSPWEKIWVIFVDSNSY